MQFVLQFFLRFVLIRIMLSFRSLSGSTGHNGTLRTFMFGECELQVLAAFQMKW